MSVSINLFQRSVVFFHSILFKKNFMPRLRTKIKPSVSSHVPVNQPAFDETHVLRELRHFLPTQTPLKDFIHHNPLHTFQHLDFYDAIFKASEIFGFQVTLQLSEYRQLYKTGRIKETELVSVISEKKGIENVEVWKERMINKKYHVDQLPRIGQLRAQWKTQYQLDIDNLVQPLLFRVLCSYLDQGISLWKFPVTGKGFLDSIRELEKNKISSFFKTKRAKELLAKKDCSLGELLKIVVGPQAYYEQYLFDQQFSHRGWSGMVAITEIMPHSLQDPRKISLRDAIFFELLLEIDTLDFYLKNSWEPLCVSFNKKPVQLFADVTRTEEHDVFMLWQDAFEWGYFDEVLAGITSLKKNSSAPRTQKSFQALFCIDERECSLRRHIEQVDTACETLGSPGFFGVEFYFQPEAGKFYEKLCPAPVTPVYLIKEYNHTKKRKHEPLYTKKTHGLVFGYLLTLIFGIWAAMQMVLNIFRPKMSPAISNAFSHMNKNAELTIENKNPDDKENGLQIGFTVNEMAARVEGLIKSIGLVKDFSSIVYVIAHGSSSANNPHHGAHDCGACSGRPGSVNARVFAWMANHKKVRSVLKEKGIDIPTSTEFVGGMHDTASDQIEFYDDTNLSEENLEKHKANKAAFEKALDLNAFERSRRFASINTKMSIKKIRKAIRDRSASLFEPRPELGHGTNSVCIIGSRDISKGLFLDRRAFLNSYDYKIDPEGKLLTGILNAISPVAGGINLEYYFSRVDNYKLGAGTKLPHHVMGLIGVANSSDGDLRAGLPLQMIEVHDPVRLLIVVEHFPDVVLKTIQSSPNLYEWYMNNWIHLI
ncbi:MAG: YbcC family protein, partial [Flavobacteriales bacterium]